MHYAITAYLDDEDELKVSLDTPKPIIRGMKRIYGNVEGNVPSSRRIVQDCDKVSRAFNAVCIHGCGMVPGLTNKNGHCNHAIGRNTSGWGWVQIKKLLVEEVGRWLYADIPAEILLASFIRGNSKRSIWTF